MKYITKTKATMTKVVAVMIRRILCRARDEELNIQTVLKRAIAKLLGKHMILKQETCHFILSLPIVIYSHQFTRINLNDDQNLLDIGDTITNGDDNKYSTESRNIILKSMEK